MRFSQSARFQPTHMHLPAHTTHQLPQEVGVPVSIVWGEEDPWEKVEWGRQLAKYASVQVRSQCLSSLVL